MNREWRPQMNGEWRPQMNGEWRPQMKRSGSHRYPYKIGGKITLVPISEYNGNTSPDTMPPTVHQSPSSRDQTLSTGNQIPPIIAPRQNLPVRKPPRHPGATDNGATESKESTETNATIGDKDKPTSSSTSYSVAFKTETQVENVNIQEDKIVQTDQKELKVEASEKHTLVIADSDNCLKNNKNITGKVSIVSIDWDSDKPAVVTDHTPLMNNNNEAMNNNNEAIEAKKDGGDKEQKINHFKQSNSVDSEMMKQKNVKIQQKVRKPGGYVGFDTLPDQVYRKSVRRGFEFNLMVVGESGLGKSTLVNSMFLADIYSSKFPGAIPSVPKTLNVETHKVMLEEKKVKLSLTVVDTPGFGDAVDNTGCWEPITNFVDEQFKKFLEAETRVNRVELPDTRVHVCLYFIAPRGHGLKPLDIEFMSRLHDKVNIIPVIGKADTFTTEELSILKKRILSQLNEFKIHIYDFPESNSKRESQQLMTKRAPFGVVGSNTVIEVEEGNRVRGRKYPWGTVIIENQDHCDFIPLRNLLLAHHMQDLKDVTNNVHYENYRCEKLTEVIMKESNCTKPIALNKNPLAALEDEDKNHEKKLERMKEEMEEVFGRKLEEKEKKIKKTEKEMEEKIEQSRDRMEKQMKELERQREEFRSEKKIWETSNCTSMEELKRQSSESLETGKKKKYGFGNMAAKLSK